MCFKQHTVSLVMSKLLCPTLFCLYLVRLDRFEKTNEMLINFNGLSNVRLQQMNENFLLHTRTLLEMKKDLDSIFRRIRSLSVCSNLFNGCTFGVPTWD